MLAEVGFRLERQMLLSKDLAATSLMLFIAYTTLSVASSSGIALESQALMLDLQHGHLVSLLFCKEYAS
jgi:hypothetical protein